MASTMKAPMVVDLYHGDVVDDWSAVKASGIVACIHKATQGSKIIDKAYAKRRAEATKAGLLWAAYHFADDSPVEDQVEHFLAVAKPDDNTMLALDYEPNGSHTMSLNDCRTFLRMVAQRTGRKPVLYSGSLIKEQMPRPDSFINSHRLWLCQYGNTPRLPAGWSECWLWQFTGDAEGPLPHECPGISTKGVDLNAYNGTPEQLAAEWAGEVVGTPIVVADARANATVADLRPVSRKIQTADVVQIGGAVTAGAGVLATNADTLATVTTQVQHVNGLATALGDFGKVVHNHAGLMLILVGAAAIGAAYLIKRFIVDDYVKNKYHPTGPTGGAS